MSRLLPLVVTALCGFLIGRRYSDDPTPVPSWVWVLIAALVAGSVLSVAIQEVVVT